MRGHLQQIRGELVVGWLLAVAGTTVYLLTLEPTVSFWDSGEFIAVSHLLQVGHPPGAPLYTLIAHLFTLMAGDNPMAVAWWSNALSALAGGVTLMFMYWTLLLTVPVEKKNAMRFPALIGVMCYLFCDTAWFSAVESEVYSLAMLMASVILWAALRWYRDADGSSGRGVGWLLLVALLTGMGACVHLLTLLVLPAVLVLVGIKGVRRLPFRFFLYAIGFFLVGLSPYVIVPVRAAAGTPINEGRPATAEAFKSYITRERYEHAPLYPRMWRHRPNDAQYAAPWSGGDTNLWGNVKYYCSYQLNYMYFRYLMWNFSGRFNDRQGYGSLQNGQFITGIPPIDRLLVGTSARPPDSLSTRGHNRYFLLPLLLGIVGMVALFRRHRRMFWTLMTVFLMGGVILSLYLNHPAYEPRERDYAYIVSFYAFALFIAYGALAIKDRCLKIKFGKSDRPSPVIRHLSSLLLLAIPFLMAFQNWDDHDRSHRFVAHDAGRNILNSCCRNSKGSVLFTYGDNDTFPLWYLQTVEKERLDVRVENVGLMGWSRFVALLEESVDCGRPVYFTHYAYNQFHSYLPGQLLLEGNAYRLRCGEGQSEDNRGEGSLAATDTVDCDSFFLHVVDDLGWHSLEGVCIDETCCKFLEQYWRDIIVLADNLADRNRAQEACAVLDKTLTEIPLDVLQDVTVVDQIAQSYQRAVDDEAARYVRTYLKEVLREQLDYYHTLPPKLQRAIPYTLGPREELMRRMEQ